MQDPEPVTRQVREPAPRVSFHLGSRRALVPDLGRKQRVAPSGDLGVPFAVAPNEVAELLHSSLGPPDPEDLRLVVHVADVLVPTDPADLERLVDDTLRLRRASLDERAHPMQARDVPSIEGLPDAVGKLLHRGDLGVDPGYVAKLETAVHTGVPREERRLFVRGSGATSSISCAFARRSSAESGDSVAQCRPCSASTRA